MTAFPKRDPLSLTSMYEDDETANLTRTWAEAVVRQVSAVRAIRQKDAQQSRDYDRAEEWSGSEVELQQTYRERWAAEHTLIWAAYQLQRWTIRLAREIRDDHRRRRIAEALDASEDPLLKDLRNALEHLDDAVLGDLHASADGTPATANRSLRRLPGQVVPRWIGGDKAFGLIDPDELQHRAEAVVSALDAESEAYTAYLIEEYLAQDHKPDDDVL